jgi:hypothetical protein
MKKTAMFLLAFSLLTASVVPAANVGAANETFKDRFNEMYDIINDPAVGYYDSEGIPYHSIETLCVEAPDYGHESTSEAASYYAWLEAVNGKINGDWSGLDRAWQCVEDFFIPSESIQKGLDRYNPSSPAGYANEFPLPDNYPAEIQSNVTVGQDPLHQELYSAYNTYAMYGMHWLVDVDNWYGYGTGDKCTFINTYQRGEQESVFETVPHPSLEEFKYGGRQGFADLFTAGETQKKWAFTIASDADGRLVQVQYWADKWAKEQGKDLSTLNAKAAKMGDYLRYSMFDKYFMKVGAQDKTPGSGYDSCLYLMSWYYAWGGAMAGDWSWKIGSSHVHWGYQAPLVAYVLGNKSEFKPKSSGGAKDWNSSFKRQVEMYAWLQSAEGAIAGGVTNSVGGQYKSYGSLSTFYDLAYDYAPVYRDPPSNNWFGMQAWSMQRMCEVYYETGDDLARQICDKWVEWAESHCKADLDNLSWEIPSTLKWEGQPDTWTGKKPDNNNLKCTVVGYGNDIGITGSLANAFFFYDQAVNKWSGNKDLGEKAANKALSMLEVVWQTCRDDYGVGVVETNGSLSRMFTQEVYIPSGWTGTMPNGDVIKSGVTFIDIRSKYKDDPWYEGIKNQTEDNLFEYTLHRYWHQVDYAVALGIAEIFGYKPVGDTQIPSDVLLGDVNLDGERDSLDFGLMRRVLLGMNSDFTGKALQAADINKDGEFNSLDFGALRLHLLGIREITK